jgi:hypothetical protein
MVLLRGSMLRAVLILGATVLAACDVGEVDIGGGGTTDAPMTNAAKTMAFDSNVKPIIMAKGCVAGPGGPCHAVQIPVLDTSVGLAARYTAGPSAQNIMITKDTVAGTPGMHSGFPYFSATDKATVAAWIDMP